MAAGSVDPKAVLLAARTVAHWVGQMAGLLACHSVVPLVDRTAVQSVGHLAAQLAGLTAALSAGLTAVQSAGRWAAQ
jgi:hypothetical protein